LKGLLIKDLYFIGKKQKSMIIFGLAFFIYFYFSGEDKSWFANAYFLFLMAMTTVSTISYDKYDNGMPFIMTLPVSPKSYVREKYLLSFILMLSAFMFETVFRFIMDLIFKNRTELIQYISANSMIILLLSVISSVYLFIYIRFESETGRNITLLVSIITLIVGMGILTLLVGSKTSGLLPLIEDITENPAILIPASIILSILIYLTSMKLSERVMKKREY